MSQNPSDDYPPDSPDARAAGALQQVVVKRRLIDVNTQSTNVSTRSKRF